MPQQKTTYGPPEPARTSRYRSLDQTFNDLRADRRSVEDRFLSLGPGQIEPEPYRWPLDPDGQPRQCCPWCRRDVVAVEAPAGPLGYRVFKCTSDSCRFGPRRPFRFRVRTGPRPAGAEPDPAPPPCPGDPR